MSCSPCALRVHAPSPVEDLKDGVHERLLQAIEHDHDEGHWVFTGSWQPSGHGVLRVAGRQYVASRVAAWVWLGGFDLEDATVRVEHRKCCRVPACVCPQHLRVVRAQAAVARRAA